MCYSKSYTSDDGYRKFFRLGLITQLAACNTSAALKGGKSKRKRKRKSKGKSKRKI